MLLATWVPVRGLVLLATWVPVRGLVLLATWVGYLCARYLDWLLGRPCRGAYLIARAGPDCWLLGAGSAAAGYLDACGPAAAAGSYFARLSAQVLLFWLPVYSPVLLATWVPVRGPDAPCLGLLVLVYAVLPGAGFFAGLVLATWVLQRPAWL